jgi:integrase
MDSAVRWRLQSKARSKGRYFWLETGRAESRRSLTLGFVSEGQAQTALDTMNREEEQTVGTPMHGRIERLFEREPAKALAYLVGEGLGEDPFGPEPADYGALSLREYYEQVYKPWRAEKKPKTWESEAGHWKRILEALGHVRVRDVDAHQVADFVDGLMVEEGARPASGNTKRLARAAVQSALNHAHRQKHLPAHVDLGIFRIEGSTRATKERKDPLTLEELQKLMNASSPKHRALWAVGAGQGLRPSELRRIAWEDVDWGNHVMKVRGDADGEGKTALSVDTIPMTPLAYRELQAWWMRQGQPGEGVVFPAEARTGGDEEEGYASRSAYRRALATASRKAKLGRTVNIYLLRHSFATIAWSLGIEMDVARRILRHADEKMLREVYCRPRPADLVAKVAAFDFAG